MMLWGSAAPLTASLVKNESIQISVLLNVCCIPTFAQISDVNLH